MRIPGRCPHLLFTLGVLAFASVPFGQQAPPPPKATINVYIPITEEAFRLELEGRTAAKTHRLLSAISTCTETRGFTNLLLVAWGKSAPNFPDLTLFHDCLVEVTPFDKSWRQVGKVVYAKLQIGKPSMRGLQLPLGDPISQQYQAARIRILPPGEKTIVTWGTVFKPQ